MGFLLTKWYLDAIGDDGETRIGYAAELAAGALSLRYASVLSASAARAPRVDTRLAGATLPEQRGEVIDWRVPSLALSGRWMSDAERPLFVELIDEPGAITWSCLQPRSSVELVLGERTMHATGYVERVLLRVPPWELPVDTLGWGRVHVGAHTLVWIDWRGPRNVKRFFLDGEEVDGEMTAGDMQVEEVQAGGLRVRLHRCTTLRDGDVGKTAFGRVPALRRLLSRHKLSMRETKWLSRATAGSESGFAIHEVVRWR